MTGFGRGKKLIFRQLNDTAPVIVSTKTATFVDKIRSSQHLCTIYYYIVLSTVFYKIKWIFRISTLVHKCNPLAIYVFLSPTPERYTVYSGQCAVLYSVHMFVNKPRIYVVIVNYIFSIKIFSFFNCHLELLPVLRYKEFN